MLLTAGLAGLGERGATYLWRQKRFRRLLSGGSQPLETFGVPPTQGRPQAKPRYLRRAGQRRRRERPAVGARELSCRASL